MLLHGSAIIVVMESRCQGVHVWCFCYEIELVCLINSLNHTCQQDGEAQDINLTDLVQIKLNNDLSRAFKAVDL